AVGLVERVELTCTSHRLGPGETLLLYTDGVTERRRGDEQFGVERLRRAGGAAAGRQAARLLTVVLVARWALLVALTAAGTVALEALAVPSPALFAGLVGAAALALLGLAPGRVARPLSISGQAVVGVVIGVLARAET